MAPRPRTKKKDARPFITTDDGVKVHPDLVQFLRPVGEVRPDPNNAVNHGDRSLATVAHSLDQYGQQFPVLVRPDGTAVAGSGRILAAGQRLKWPRIAVLVWHGTDAAADAFAVMDNRSNEHHAWNYDRLADVLAAGEANALTFDDFGFTGEEAGAIIAGQLFEGAPDEEVRRGGNAPKTSAKRVLVHVEDAGNVAAVRAAIETAVAGMPGVRVR